MKTSPSVAIIVPIFKDSFTKYENFSFYHNAKIFEKRDIYLIGPKRLETYMKSLCKTISNGNYRLVDDKYFDGTLNGNTRLMRSKVFYSNFNCFDFILVCHFDAIVFEDQLDYWMSLNFDYIGAPLFYQADNTLNNIRKGGNGGLCLRKVKSHLNIIEKRKRVFSILRTILKLNCNWDVKIKKYSNYLKMNYYKLLLKKNIYEDSYWSEIVPDIFQEYKVAGFDYAKSFAFEQNMKLLYELNSQKLPMGIHAWWKYDEEFSLKLIQLSRKDKKLIFIND